MARGGLTTQDVYNFAKRWSSEAIIRNLVKALADDGERVIRRAYNSRRWDNRLNNLWDSFVSAVFINGKLQNGKGKEHGTYNTIRYANDTPQSKGSRLYGWVSGNVGDIDITGRGEAANFLASYELRHGFEKGIRLVVAATMFYATFLEDQGYQVISQIDYQLMKLRNKKYNVRVAYYAGGDIKYDFPEILFEVKRTDTATYGANAFKGFSKGKELFG